MLVLNFLHDIFSIKFYMISLKSFHDIFTFFYWWETLRDECWILKYFMKVFHISWNDPETVFHEMPWKKNFSVFFPLQSSKTSVLILSLYIPIFFECSVSLWVYLRNQERVSFIWWYWHWYYTFIDLSYCYTDDNSNPLCFKVTKSKTKYSSCIIIW